MNFDWKINGNQYQATREGYNLLDLSNYFDTTETKNGVTRKIYNNGISITGTSTAITNFWLNDLNISLTAGIFNLYLETENSNVTYIFKDSDGNSIIQTKTLGQKELTKNTTITQILIQVASGVTMNLNCNLMIYQGNVSKPYEQYGTSPSPDYPSEIKTVNGSVKIDVVNSNLLDFNVAQDSRVTVNKDGTLTINGTGGFVLNIDKLQLKAGITYYQKVELTSGSISGSNINNTFLSFAGAGAWISSENFSQTNLTKDTEKTTIWINATAIFNNAVIKIWANIDKSDFVKHQSQTAIMPVQQEMLEGDYISDVEHHEWTKIVLDGTENWREITTNNLKRFFYEVSVASINDNNSVNCISNYFKGTSRNKLESSSGDEISVADKFLNILSKKIETKEDFKAWLKSKYDEGNPVIVYYKLVTPLNLELTPEQKAVRKTKLYTYKNITNIDVSDELASIDVNYKKDLETMFNNIIKQIPSSTNDTAET